MQRLEVSGAVRPIYGSLGVKRLTNSNFDVLLTVPLIIILVTNLIHKFLFYNKFILFLYMFRALCAHHQEIKIVLYSIWYHHTLLVAVRRTGCACAPDGHIVLETCRGI